LTPEEVTEIAVTLVSFTETLLKIECAQEVIMNNQRSFMPGTAVQKKAQIKIEVKSCLQSIS
jgi:hypothetical protein